MKVFKLAVWALSTLALLVFFVALAGQNQDVMSVTLFNQTTQEYPKWAMLTVSFFIGTVLATVFFIVQLIILETKNIRLRRLNNKLERALANQKPGLKDPVFEDV
jgi:uncharacterized membrane protein YciS (DUF1049 family)